MSNVESIEIIEYNSLDSLTLSIPDDVSVIQLSYSPEITDISIDYVNEITNIELNVGAAVQSIYSVNGLYGEINLTATGTISSTTASSGIYIHTFTHNLGHAYPVVSVYNSDGEMVFANVVILDSNNVTIKSAIDLTGYRVVVQR